MKGFVKELHEVLQTLTSIEAKIIETCPYRCLNHRGQAICLHQDNNRGVCVLHTSVNLSKQKTGAGRQRQEKPDRFHPTDQCPLRACMPAETEEAGG